MCVKIAMSAQLRGWTETEYLTELHHYRHGIWRQLTTRPGGRQMHDAAGYKALRSAWVAAVDNNKDRGIRTKEEIATDAVELAYMWADRITDDTDNLTPAESAVMGYVISETERRGFLRVTCPCREVGEFAKVPSRTAARILLRLTARGLLINHYAGRRRRPGNKGRAAIYGLPDPERVAHTHTGKYPYVPPAPGHAGTTRGPS